MKRVPVGKRGYTLHRGEYGRPPVAVVRFESDGTFVRETGYGELTEAERGWLAEVMPHMHGTSSWGFAEQYDRPGTGAIGPVLVSADA